MICPSSKVIPQSGKSVIKLNHAASLHHGVKNFNSHQRNARATKSKSPCAYSLSPSELLFCSSRTKRLKNHTFSYFIFWVWLLLCNVFHLWQADKLGFMWHNNRVPLLLFQEPKNMEQRKTYCFIANQTVVKKQMQC